MCTTHTQKLRVNLTRSTLSILSLTNYERVITTKLYTWSQLSSSCIILPVTSNLCYLDYEWNRYTHSKSVASQSRHIYKSVYLVYVFPLQARFN